MIRRSDVQDRNATKLYGRKLLLRLSATPASQFQNTTVRFFLGFLNGNGNALAGIFGKRLSADAQD